MEKQFIPYEFALKLKELGFDELCIAYYSKHGNAKKETFGYVEMSEVIGDKIEYYDSWVISAPLWQQVFDWFKNEHNLFAEFSFNTLRNKYDWCIPVNIHRGYCSEDEYDTYEEARLECLKKLIEITT